MKIARLTIPALLIALALASCASAPVEENAPSETTAPADATAVQQAKADADAARTEAEDAKAPKAAKAKFEEAGNLYSEAVEAENGEDYETAVDLFSRSAAAYRASTAAANTAREEALAAMKAADEAISETETAADAAVREAEGEDS